jgi:hypothetical protein
MVHRAFDLAIRIYASLDDTDSPQIAHDEQSKQPTMWYMHTT